MCMPLWPQRYIAQSAALTPSAAASHGKRLSSSCRFRAPAAWNLGERQDAWPSAPTSGLTCSVFEAAGMSHSTRRVAAFLTSLTPSVRVAAHRSSAARWSSVAFRKSPSEAEASLRSSETLPAKSQRFWYTVLLRALMRSSSSVRLPAACESILSCALCISCLRRCTSWTASALSLAPASARDLLSPSRESSRCRRRASSASEDCEARSSTRSTSSWRSSASCLSRVSHSDVSSLTKAVRIPLSTSSSLFSRPVSAWRRAASSSWIRMCALSKAPSAAASPCCLESAPIF
mmetsp:Transcript_529/g.1815  ORF Transcript_529/g.1815 Transcript_529/m.1815 type:complete len:290 (+) Transcript_529:1339-2208(+)